jgi:hypothetical protein
MTLLLRLFTSQLVFFSYMLCFMLLQPSGTEYSQLYSTGWLTLVSSRYWSPNKLTTNDIYEMGWALTIMWSHIEISLKSNMPQQWMAVASSHGGNDGSASSGIGGSSSGEQQAAAASSSKQQQHLAASSGTCQQHSATSSGGWQQQAADLPDSEQQQQ